MELIETTKLIIWINQFDPFVQANDAAADIWHHSMVPISYREAEAAVVEHYRANPGQQAQPGAILKRALNNRSTKDAGQRAIEVPQTRREINATDGKRMQSWRQRNPEEWTRLMEEGRQERLADLRRRGLI